MKTTSVVTVAAAVVASFSVGLAVRAGDADSAIPPRMVGTFAMDPSKPSTLKCPAGWKPFDASGKFVRGAAWDQKTGNAVPAAPEAGNLSDVKIDRADQLPPLEVDLRSQVRVMPGDPRPNVFRGDAIYFFGTTGSDPGWGNSMRPSSLQATIGGTSRPLAPIVPPSVTLMTCVKK